jgi:molecular chaperone GrpE
VDWRDRALRLQAEMDNTRKRLQRDQALQVEAERQRLLRSFLRVVDDLERALAAPAGDREASRLQSIPQVSTGGSGSGASGPQGAGGGCEALRQGIQLTHHAALQLLQGEGVEQIQVAASGQPFDPSWHEAVMTVDHGRAGAAPDTIVEVVEPGYRRQDQLLRPARVIVAV